MTPESNQIPTPFFHSHGKLLLSGEYLVLEGARALAVPLQYGQSLQVQSVPSVRPLVHWQSWQHDDLLLDLTWEPETPNFNHVSGQLAPAKLQELFTVAGRLNPSFPQKGMMHAAVSRLDFDINWGFGSSSSLVSNIAWWADVDPYELNRRVFGGSGYDIACARAASPIMYHLLQNAPPAVQPVAFDPPFINQLFVVYSGRKQNTRHAMAGFKKSGKPAGETLQRITEISEEMAVASQLNHFEHLMKEHEQIVSKILAVAPIKEMKFKDFAGNIKSLGAWGGDCWLVSWKDDPRDLKAYFKAKGYHTIFSLKELMLQS